MIKIEQLRDFVSGNFTSATLSGKKINDKIELELKLDSKENNESFIHIYNVDLEKTIKEPENILNYLLEKYLENNTIIGIQYFANIQHHSDKVAFIIRSFNNSFTIALRQECMDLLPNDFISKLEFTKRNGILKNLGELNIKEIKVHNFDKVSLYRNYKTGLREDTIRDGVFHYDALRIEGNKGETVNYEGELEFVFKMFQILIEKGNVNLDDLKRIDNLFKTGYYNSIVEYELNDGIKFSYELNDKIKFSADTKDDLSVFKEFLNKYLNNYRDDVKGNQMKLILSREGE